MKNKTRRIISTPLNIIIFLLVIFAVVYQFRSSNQYGSSGWIIFRYYTVLSNIIAGVSAVVYAAFVMHNGKIPTWAEVFKYTGTAVISVTFFTVMLFLGPLFGYELMFTGPSLYMHLIVPLLCFITFFIFDEIRKLRLLHILFPIGLTMIYGAVYIVNVMIIGEGKGGWPDFYGFTLGGMWYLSITLMLAGTALLAFLAYLIKKKVVGR